jgi:hypothetical protein
MSGLIATEYVAQVAAPRRPRASPFRLDERFPPDPIATRPTPTNERPAANQNRTSCRSTPLLRAINPVKMGSVPNRRATVVAVVKSRAYTKESWLAKSTTVQPATRGRSLRPTRSVPSNARVMAAKISAAHA